MTCPFIAYSHYLRLGFIQNFKLKTLYNILLFNIRHDFPKQDYYKQITKSYLQYYIPTANNFISLWLW